MSILNLGSRPEGPLTLKINTLQRHYACFGSSGCGKTVLSKVLIEELASNGVPVIAIDPQAISQVWLSWQITLDGVFGNEMAF